MAVQLPCGLGHSESHAAGLGLLGLNWPAPSARSSVRCVLDGPESGRGLLPMGGLGAHGVLLLGPRERVQQEGTRQSGGGGWAGFGGYAATSSPTLRGAAMLAGGACAAGGEIGGEPTRRSQYVKLMHEDAVVCSVTSQSVADESHDAAPQPPPQVRRPLGHHGSESHRTPADPGTSLRDPAQALRRSSAPGNPTPMRTWVGSCDSGAPPPRPSWDRRGASPRRRHLGRAPVPDGGLLRPRIINRVRPRC